MRDRYYIDLAIGKEVVGPVVAAERGDGGARAAVEAMLPQLEEKGWCISETVRRIWGGERDWHRLAEGVDRNSALLILRVLEELGEG